MRRVARRNSDSMSSDQTVAFPLHIHCDRPAVSGADRKLLHREANVLERDWRHLALRGPPDKVPNEHRQVVPRSGNAIALRAERNGGDH